MTPVPDPILHSNFSVQLVAICGEAEVELKHLGQAVTSWETEEDEEEENEDYHINYGTVSPEDDDDPEEVDGEDDIDEDEGIDIDEDEGTGVTGVLTLGINATPEAIAEYIAYRNSSDDLVVATITYRDTAGTPVFRHVFEVSDAAELIQTHGNRTSVGSIDLELSIPYRACAHFVAATDLDL